MELFETELSTLQGGPLPAINPINGLMKSYKWVTGFIKLLLGVIALFITGSGAHLGREVDILQLYFLKTYC